LLENEMIGLTCEDEIDDGQKVRMYCPIPGDELLVRSVLLALVQAIH